MPLSRYTDDDVGYIGAAAYCTLARERATATDGVSSHVVHQRLGDGIHRHCDARQRSSARMCAIHDRVSRIVCAATALQSVEWHRSGIVFFFFFIVAILRLENQL